MTARSAPQVLSSRIRERQTAASTASMPNPRPWRRGQAPKPHRGAPKAQGLTAAIAVAGPSPVPSIAPDDPASLNSTGADVPMCAFATSRIYTSLTGTTEPMIRLDLRPRRNPSVPRQMSNAIPLAGPGDACVVSSGSSGRREADATRNFVASRCLRGRPVWPSSARRDHGG